MLCVCVCVCVCVCSDAAVRDLRRRAALGRLDADIDANSNNNNNNNNNNGDAAYRNKLSLKRDSIDDEYDSPAIVHSTDDHKPEQVRARVVMAPKPKR